VNDIMAAFNTIADALDQRAAWLEDQLAGGEPPKWLVREAVIAQRYIAAVARGDTTPEATS
jgi:hypothetical protein